jgi:alanine or glycine:cation symporter, AGCS family
MADFIYWLDGLVWSIGLVIFALGAGLFFSIKTRFLQVRYFKEMLRLLFEKKNTDTGITPFQSFSIALSGRVGIGNIAGVATAIALGGPGAVFWMWIMAILGGASAFVESTLAQIYKVKIGEEYRGGTPFFIDKGLGIKWFGVLVAIVVTFSYGVLVPGIQSNTIASGFQNSLGIDPRLTGVVLIGLLAIIIFGGVKRIAQAAQLMVPFMSIGYLLVTLIILLANIKEIPDMFALIISSAFGANEMFGGIVGAAITWGVKRAVFSNVAGVGEGTYSSAAAEVSHPAKQGLVQAFSVYIDTLLVCTCTALMILVTGMYSVTPEGQEPIVNTMEGIEPGPAYTQAAVESVIPGFGSAFVSIAIFFFAFTTLFAYYFIAETTLIYLDRSSKMKWLKTLFNIVFLITVYVGCVQSASLLWALGDTGFGLMGWLNLFTILLLSKPALKVFKDYERQKKEGKDPVFDPREVGIVGADFWEENLVKVNTGNKTGTVNSKDKSININS